MLLGGSRSAFQTKARNKGQNPRGFFFSPPHCLLTCKPSRTGQFGEICHAYLLLWHPYDISAQGMWKPFTFGCIDGGLKARGLRKMTTWQFDCMFFLSVCGGIGARIPTVSPVPRTITSYSSSMLYQRRSRRSLPAKEMKVLLQESLSEGPQNRGGVLSASFCFGRLDRGGILLDNRRHLMTNGTHGPPCHRRRRPKMALIAEHSRTMTVRVRN